MSCAKSPDQEPTRKRGSLSWRKAMAAWLIISLAGWVAIAALVALLTPEQAGTVATDKELKDLQKVAPAAGPRGKPGQ